MTGRAIDSHAASVLDRLFDVESEFRVGQHYLWEPTKPHAATRIRITGVKTNADGETWVESQLPDGRTYWNELDRMREACVPFTRRQRLRSWWALRGHRA